MCDCVRLPVIVLEACGFVVRCVGQSCLEQNFIIYANASESGIQLGQVIVTFVCTLASLADLDEK